AVQLLAVLLAAGVAFASGDPRLLLAAQRFAPLLLLGAALLPEPGLLSRRNAIYFGVVALFALLGAFAPAHVFAGLVEGARWLAFGLPPERGAALLTGAASALCLARWAITGRPMEFGLVLVLAAAAVAYAQADASRAFAGFATAGAAAVLAILYASYRMAFVDGLTGLPNRRALDETLMRVSGGYALAMVDVDHFKQFNDTYGHDAGDIVLRVVARTLRRHAGGQAFRYGGEEFCIVYEGGKSRRAAEGCERVREAVAKTQIAVPAATKRSRRDEPPKKRPASNVKVTISLGWAQRAGERRAAHDVLKAADQALYKAKAKGRNCVVMA
ncbi:MAG TPA: GGDEF domain-containing protein, partial [Xanthomonadales bacterium]|nr:GGDEF domain-containing protein [Xanthomonadales bacterium]